MSVSWTQLSWVDGREPRSPAGGKCAATRPNVRIFGVPGRPGFGLSYLDVRPRNCLFQGLAREILLRNAKSQGFVNPRTRRLRTYLVVFQCPHSSGNERFLPLLIVHETCGTTHPLELVDPSTLLSCSSQTQRLHQVLN